MANIPCVLESAVSTFSLPGRGQVAEISLESLGRSQIGLERLPGESYSDVGGDTGCYQSASKATKLSWAG